MGVGRKRESRNSGPGSRWPAGDLGRKAQAFKVKKEPFFFFGWFSSSGTIHISKLENSKSGPRVLALKGSPSEEKELFLRW